MIEFRDVTKVYGSTDTKALSNVNIKYHLDEKQSFKITTFTFKSK